MQTSCWLNSHKDKLAWMRWVDTSVMFDYTMALSSTWHGKLHTHAHAATIFFVPRQNITFMWIAAMGMHTIMVRNEIDIMSDLLDFLLLKLGGSRFLHSRSWFMHKSKKIPMCCLGQNLSWFQEETFREEFIQIRVCNSHMVSTAFILAVWCKQSAVNMFSM